MLLKQWTKLPDNMRFEEIWKYYDALSNRKLSLIFKRIFDICVALIMLVVLLPLFMVIAIAIVVDSRGSVFFLQERVTTYGKRFKIIKFRTMVPNAERMGSQVTTSNDMRITRVGKHLRRFRLDEIPQLINIITGSMTFVGTRPEVPKYVDYYTPVMMATLLLSAGVTSLASIYYKDEAELLDAAEDADKVYVEQVLPGKMYYNLKAIEQFNFWNDIKVMFMTVAAVLGKEYKRDYEPESASLNVMEPEQEKLYK